MSIKVRLNSPVSFRESDTIILSHPSVSHPGVEGRVCMKSTTTFTQKTGVCDLCDTKRH